jgi:hypothetical protein
MARQRAASKQVEGAEQLPGERAFTEQVQASEWPATSVRHVSASFTFAVVFVAVAYLALIVPLAIILIVGGLKMKRLESYGLSVFASIAAFVPLHPLFLFGLPIGIWSLVVLGRRRTRIGFRQAGRLADQDEFRPPPAGKEMEASPAKPVIPPRQQDALSRVRGPAIGILVVGSINTVILLFLIASVTFGRTGVFELVAIALPSLVGLVQLRCGWAMYHAQSHGMSMAAAIASVLPVSPTWMFSVAFGVWGLVVLQRPDVRELYASREVY